ncbi:MAG: DUF3592 domain-containing protein [Algoriphagus sp.]|jgi:hypothetical protein|nr:DUF3592 domain-containing protein [Algoriphagus sp.]
MTNEIILFLISLGAMGVGIHLWQKGSYLLKNGKKASAVIFKNNYSKGSPGNSGTYYPVVRFLTDKQVWITQELSIGYNPPKKEGTKVEVIYDPEEPTDVEINSRFQLEILPRLLVCIGVMLLVFGFLELFDVTQFI